MALKEPVQDELMMSSNGSCSSDESVSDESALLSPTVYSGRSLMISPHPLNHQWGRLTRTS